jgi:hypothetical protein
MAYKLPYEFLLAVKYVMRNPANPNLFGNKFTQNNQPFQRNGAMAIFPVHEFGKR